MSRIFLLFIGATLTASLLAQEGQGPPLRVDFTGPYPDIPEQTAPMQTTGPLRVDFAGPYPDVQDPAAMAAPETGPLRVDFTGPDPDQMLADTGGPSGSAQPPPAQDPGPGSTGEGAQPPGGPQTGAPNNQRTATNNAPAGGPRIAPGEPAPPPQNDPRMSPTTGGLLQTLAPPSPRTPNRQPTNPQPPARARTQPTSPRAIPGGQTGTPASAMIASYGIRGECAKLGSVITINGRGFGRQGMSQLVLLVNGNPNRMRVVVRSWTDRRIQIQLPNDPALLNSKAQYAFALRDRSRQLISNADKTLTFCR